jgi:hypothetical protein
MKGQRGRAGQKAAANHPHSSLLQLSMATKDFMIYMDFMGEMIMQHWPKNFKSLLLRESYFTLTIGNALKHFQYCHYISLQFLLHNGRRGSCELPHKELLRHSGRGTTVATRIATLYVLSMSKNV